MDESTKEFSEDLSKVDYLINRIGDGEYLDAKDIAEGKRAWARILPLINKENG